MRLSLYNGHAIVSSDGFEVIFTCYRGYKLEGSDYRRCNITTGEWSGTFPSCKFACDFALSHPDNGKVTVSLRLEIATSWCNQGYPCRKIASPRNGRAEEHSFEVQYSCDARYVPVGNPIRTCNESGLWTGSPPSCVYSRCGNLTRPENGNVIYSLFLGTLKATYTCKAPLKLIGYSNRTCSRSVFSSRWSGDAPSCEYCYPLSRAFNNGVVTVSSDKLVTRYACNSGYKLIGNTLQICNRTTALWSGVRPRCLHACPQLENTENGTVFTQGIRAMCSSGYKPKGNFTVRICNVTTGQWSGSALSCVFGCSSLTPNITNGFGTFMGTFIRFRCRPGYRLVGAAEIHCRSSFLYTELQTKWSEPFPACSPCRRPYPPSNGSVSEQNLQVTYRCREESILVGNEVRYCNETTGEWSGSDPSCKYLGLEGYVHKRCFRLRAPLDGQVSYSLVGANVKATYTCRPGFSLQGNANRLCVSTSTYYSHWSGGFTQKCFTLRKCTWQYEDKFALELLKLFC
ncbi:CUB and sushi domain-containing protein 1-like [Oscarella lobularis]|uniref:CUB and sushi domain-containing protein 1-like n=1 Tax=Oscarella lobularis TaxID=121494 RepID=UPI003313F322